MTLEKTKKIVEASKDSQTIVLEGLVVSKAGDKTVTVKIERQSRHPVYQKKISKSKKFLVHDETNEVKVGDVVKIGASRPLSAKKRWRVVK